MPKKNNNEVSYTEVHKELERQIREQDFKKVYMICGEQDYLRTQNRNLLSDAILGGGDEMNRSYYTGENFTVPEIIDLAETLPFFADRRVIVFENSWLFAKPPLKSTEEMEQLADYLPKMPDTTHMIFVERAPNKTYKLYRSIKKNGFVIDCTTPDENQLRTWVVKHFRDAGLQITGGAFSVFMEYAGTDMLNIQSEAEKLVSYCAGTGQITEDDVRAICSRQVQDRIFDMISAIGYKRADEALSIYMDLIRLQTPPQVILSLLLRQFNQLLQLFEMQGKTSAKEMAERLHLNYFVLTKKVMPMLKGYTDAELVQDLRALVQADADYKSGRIDARIAVEKLIVQFTAVG